MARTKKGQLVFGDPTGGYLIPTEEDDTPLKVEDMWRSVMCTRLELMVDLGLADRAVIYTSQFTVELSRTPGTKRLGDVVGEVYARLRLPDNTWAKGMIVTIPRTIHVGDLFAVCSMVGQRVVLMSILRHENP